jgi:hypothetical protein
MREEAELPRAGQGDRESGGVPLVVLQHYCFLLLPCFASGLRPLSAPYRASGPEERRRAIQPRMTERNRKLPQSTYYLRAARAGIQMLEQQKPMDDRLLFFVAGILACLRAVQHSLLNHDRTLSPAHKAAIDEWKNRTPMDGREISFIKNSRDLILKAGAFPGGAGFPLADVGPDGRSFREVLAGSTPASIRRLQSNVVTQIPA